MSRYRRMRRGRVTQVQGIASRGEDFFLMRTQRKKKGKSQAGIGWADLLPL